MQLRGAVISDFKSVNHAEIPLGGLTVLCGPNGAGKTNLIEALGTYDPLAGASFARVGSAAHAANPRVALVAEFDVSADGLGVDRNALLEMIAAPWAEEIPAMEIPEGIGAYCGSTWWLYGGDLYSASDRSSLSTAYNVIRNSLMRNVPGHLRTAAGRFIDLLLDKPIVLVQEDFAVELSCDRQSDKGKELSQLSHQLADLTDGALSDLLGPFREWTARWPPLTLLTRGPGADGNGTPAGFEWITERFGGVRAVAVDINTVEAYLDGALEKAHDRLQHQPDPDDEFCATCLSPAHGGRVDPTLYSDRELTFQGSPTWLEEREAEPGWFRVRPTLLDTLAIIEGLANSRLPDFVAAQGEVCLTIRPVPEWDAAPARCRIMFNVDPGENDPEPADWGGPIGVLGYPRSAKDGVLQVPLSDLGAGISRWVAATVREAADDLAGRVGHDGLPDQRISPRILVIDEPEQHLHPHAQEIIAAWALERARQYDAVVLATHASAFLMLPPSQVTICQVYRVGHETCVRPLPVVHDVEVVDRARKLGFELGLGRLALAQLTRAVIVVEGEWDRRMLLRFFGTELGEKRLLVIPLQGSEELGGMAEAAVLPTLGVPVIALLDEVRASSWEELAALTGPLSKAERALRDLANSLKQWLHVVQYADPDVICALPEAAVRLAYPEAGFTGWDDLLHQWSKAVTQGETTLSFKRWVLAHLSLPSKDRYPTTFFHRVLEYSDGTRPSDRFTSAFVQSMNYIANLRSRTNLRSHSREAVEWVPIATPHVYRMEPRLIWIQRTIRFAPGRHCAVLVLLVMYRIPMPRASCRNTACCRRRSGTVCSAIRFAAFKNGDSPGVSTPRGPGSNCCAARPWLPTGRRPARWRIRR